MYIQGEIPNTAHPRYFFKKINQYSNNDFWYF